VCAVTPCSSYSRRLDFVIASASRLPPSICRHSWSPCGRIASIGVPSREGRVRGSITGFVVTCRLCTVLLVVAAGDRTALSVRSGADSRVLVAGAGGRCWCTGAAFVAGGPGAAFVTRDQARRFDWSGTLRQESNLRHAPYGGADLPH